MSGTDCVVFCTLKLKIIYFGDRNEIFSQIMKEAERKTIELFEQEIIEALIPTDLLPSLRCLTQADRDEITSHERLCGDIRAAKTLLKCLKRLPFAFGEFLNALETKGLSYLAEKLMQGRGT